MKDQASLPRTAWALWRQDDNGHRFLVCVKGTRAEAEELRVHYESLGHKQYYFVEPFESTGGADGQA